MLGVMVGHVLKLPALIALIRVSSVGKPAAVCRYWTVWLIKGRPYTLFALSFFVLSSARLGIPGFMVFSSVFLKMFVSGRCGNLSFLFYFCDPAASRFSKILG